MNHYLIGVLAQRGYIAGVIFDVKTLIDLIPTDDETLLTFNIQENLTRD